MSALIESIYEKINLIEEQLQSPGCDVAALQELKEQLVKQLSEANKMLEGNNNLLKGSASHPGTLLKG